MKIKTLVLCIDAFRHDYINKKRTPFLSKFKKKILKPSFEYGISSYLLTGKKPEENDLWVNFKLAPNSIYKKISFIKNNKIVGLIANAARIMKGNYFLSGTHKIPDEMLAHFDLQTKQTPYKINSLKNKTLFDLLNKRGKNYLVLDWPLMVANKKVNINLKTRTDEGLAEELTKKFSEKISFYYAHIRSVDSISHYKGPLNNETIKRVREIDELIKKAVEEFLKEFPDSRVILFSDHGMERVKGYVNLQETKEYCEYYFFDSTIARFWPKQKKKLIQILSAKKHGRILDEEDKKNLGINFKHDKFGEMLFALEPGYVIHPDFFHGKNKVKGMHTYYKESKDNNGFFISNKKTGKESKINMKDLHETIKSIISD